MIIKRVAVAVSGGVDSAVTALILKRKGYEVHGVFMKNWDVAEETGFCSATRDAEDALWVCNHIGVPFHIVDFVKEYWHEVFTHLLNDYQTGFTPNPDILCNRHIKFNRFYKYARYILDADAISTGHYAQTSYGAFLEHWDNWEGVHLLKAVDDFKDQTFFLSQVHQEPLQKTMFPLGHLLKSEVKNIAKSEGMDKIVRKKESMGICFIGSRNFQEFIAEYIEPQPGNFLDIDQGNIVGSHKGIHYWTVGQGCRIGGQSMPFYIVKKDDNSNDILVAKGTDHPSLLTSIILTSKPHWIHSTPHELLYEGIVECEFRFQHTKALIKCKVNMVSGHGLLIRLKEPLRAITPGQYAVFYKGQECLGSARILISGPSLYALGRQWKKL